MRTNTRTKTASGYRALAGALSICAAFGVISAAGYINHPQQAPRQARQRIAVEEMTDRTPGKTAYRARSERQDRDQTLEQRVTYDGNGTEDRAGDRAADRETAKRGYDLFTPEQLPRYAPLPFYAEVSHTAKAIASHFNIKNERQFAALIYATCKNESSFRKYATSHKGARGVMQIMPHMDRRVTHLLAKAFGRQQKKPSSPWDIKSNYEKGAYLLADAYVYWAKAVGPEKAINYAIMEFNTGRPNVMQGAISEETQAYRERVKADISTYYNILGKHS